MSTEGSKEEPNQNMSNFWSQKTMSMDNEDGGGDSGVELQLGWCSRQAYSEQCSCIRKEGTNFLFRLQ